MGRKTNYRNQGLPGFKSSPGRHHEEKLPTSKERRNFIDRLPLADFFTLIITGLLLLTLFLISSVEDTKNRILPAVAVKSQISGKNGIPSKTQQNYDFDDSGEASPVLPSEPPSLEPWPQLASPEWQSPPNLIPNRKPTERENAKIPNRSPDAK